MKKILSYILLTSLVFILTACDTTTDENKYLDDTNNNDNNIEEYYIPSGVEFSFYKGISGDNEIDVSEYFNVSFSCPSRTVWDDCFGADLGKSVESAGFKMHTGSSVINGVEEADVNTITIDLTFYALESEDISIYSTFLFENEEGDIKREQQIGVDFASGVSTFGEVMGEKDDGEVIVVNYTFHFVTIDTLEKVTIKQFDMNDTLLEEDVVLQASLLETLTLNQDAAYYFIIEEYVDADGEHYQERTYNDASSPSYYLYKFTNELGFLNGDMLIIE